MVDSTGCGWRLRRAPMRYGTTDVLHEVVLDYMRAGDTLVVASLDRLGRSLQDLISIVAGLRRRGIGFRSLHEALDTITPAVGWCSTSSLPWPNSSAS